MDVEQSLQERYAPASICFGCGPANARGLRIRSFPAADHDQVVADWTPGPEHQAFPGVLNGGIIGTLMDCHSNWTAAHHLMRRRRADRPPTTVTAEFAVRLLKPTPAEGKVHLRARVVDSSERRATVEAQLLSAGEVTATCQATFVAVSQDHPAFERW
jgi:acyl-coenzyme A thioesterase PaaI-like protein